MISHLFKLHLNIIRIYPLGLLTFWVCSVLFNDVISWIDFVALVMDGWMDEWAGSAVGILMTGERNDVFWEKSCPSVTAFTTNPIRTSLGLNLVSSRWWDVGNWQSEPWGSLAGCWSVPITKMKLPFFNYVLLAWADTDFDYRTWQYILYIRIQGYS